MSGSAARAPISGLLPDGTTVRTRRQPVLTLATHAKEQAAFKHTYPVMWDGVYCARR